MSRNITPGAGQSGTVRMCALTYSAGVSDGSGVSATGSCGEAEAAQIVDLGRRLRYSAHDPRLAHRDAFAVEGGDVDLVRDPDLEAAPGDARERRRHRRVLAVGAGP